MMNEMSLGLEMAMNITTRRHSADAAALRNFYAVTPRYSYNRGLRAILAVITPVLCWSAVFGIGALLFN